MSMVVAFPSLVNLVVKLWLFLHAREALTGHNKSLGLLLALFFMLNLVEFIAFFPSTHIYADQLVWAYFCTLIPAVAMMLVFADRLSYQLLNPVPVVLTVIALCGLIIGTDLFVTGGHSEGYTVTRDPGTYYLVIVGYVLLCIVSSLVLLFVGGKKLPDPLRRKKCTVAFFGFLSVSLAMIFVIIMMAIGKKLFGFHVNGSVFISFGISGFLAVLILSEVHYKVFNLVGTVPTFTFQTFALVMKFVYSLCRNKTINLSELLEQIEDVFIDEGLVIYEGNKKLTAEQLCIPESSFYRKMRDRRIGDSEPRMIERRAKK